MFSLAGLYKKGVKLKNTPSPSLVPPGKCTPDQSDPTAAPGGCYAAGYSCGPGASFAFGPDPWSTLGPFENCKKNAYYNCADSKYFQVPNGKYKGEGLSCRCCDPKKPLKNNKYFDVYRVPYVCDPVTGCENKQCFKNESKSFCVGKSLEICKLQARTFCKKQEDGSIVFQCPNSLGKSKNLKGCQCCVFNTPSVDPDRENDYLNVYSISP